MRQFFLILFVAIAFSCGLKAQVGIQKPTLSDSIELVKSLMRKDGSVQSYAIYHGGHISNQFQRFIYLTNYLSVNEFLQLTTDTSACLRVYGYAGLIYKRYKKISSIKVQLEKDSTLVNYTVGCRSGDIKVCVVVAELHRWCRKSIIKYALKQQNENKLAWYTHFVFSN